MKFMLTLLTSFSLLNCFSQSYIQYKDTANQFAINIPSGWRYGPGKDSRLQLIAYKNPDSTDRTFGNFNLNILQKPNSSLDNEYNKLIRAMESTNNFARLESDTITIHGQLFKWFIETHKNDVNSEMMLHNYVFVTYKGGKTYILTFVTASKYFDKYRLLFYQIATSFIP